MKVSPWGPCVTSGGFMYIQAKENPVNCHARNSFGTFVIKTVANLKQNVYSFSLTSSTCWRKTILKMLVYLTHSVPRNKPLAVVLTRPEKQGPHSAGSTFVLLKNTASFKTDFLPMKGENSITSYCAVLTFKSAKIQWLVKETLVV